MLHKALLSSPKEFRISIGTQTYCTASVNKSSAMPGDLVTVIVRSNTGYGNIKVAVSPSVEVTKVNGTTFTFVMPFTDVAVNASASALDFRINVSKTGQGTVTVKSLAKYGETVTVTISAGANYELGSISASGVTLSGSGNTRTFTMPAKDVTIALKFVDVVYELTVGVYNYRDDTYYGYGTTNNNGTYGAMNKIPYWQKRSWYLTDLGVHAYARDSEYPDNLTYSGDIRANGRAIDSASLTFKDGVTIWISMGNDYSHSQYETLRKHKGEVATVKFSTAPDGYL